MSPRPRRRSIDSSDSDSSCNKHKLDKEHNHHETRDYGYNDMPSTFVSHFPSGHGSPTIPNFPSGYGSPSIPHFPPGHGSPATAHFPSDHVPAMPHFPSHHDSSSMYHTPPSHDEKSISQTKSATEYNQHTLLGGAHSTPPPYSAAPALPAPPSSGFRIPLSTTGVFPDPQTLGPPPCYDADGSPIYIGSALLGNSVHPCKIGKHLQTHVAVPYGGAEYYHKGRYDLLPYRPDQMEFVPTSYGRIPPGRRLVEGGYEDHGAKLYHAVALINGIRVPGKAAEHLGGCNVAFGGAEHIIQGNYEILCWR